MDIETDNTIANLNLADIYIYEAKSFICEAKFVY